MKEVWEIFFYQNKVQIWGQCQTGKYFARNAYCVNNLVHKYRNQINKDQKGIEALNGK